MIFFHFDFQPVRPEFLCNGIAGIQGLERTISGDITYSFQGIILHLINSHQFRHCLVYLILALIIGVAAPEGWAGFVCPVELDEAEIFFEINATDGDGGIQLFLDGKAWKRVTIFTPNWRRHVTVTAGGNLRPEKDIIAPKSSY